MVNTTHIINQIAAYSKLREIWKALKIGFSYRLVSNRTHASLQSECMCPPQTHALEHSCQADHVSKWHIQIIRTLPSGMGFVSLFETLHSYTLGGDC